MPAAARTLADGRIDVGIEAWVHEIESRPGSRMLLARWLGLDRKAMTAEESALFDARTQLFRVDSERRKAIRVRFADGSEHGLPATGNDGRSTAQFTVDARLLGMDGSITFDVVMPVGDPRQFGGRALHVPTHGISVVSDIDDTIKQSNVRDRRELLRSTFARPFVAVLGMAESYRGFAARVPAATRFLYVSSSPLQLLPSLADFIHASGFPDGSMHLRALTSFRSLLRAGGDSSAHKLGTIRTLIGQFPRRRFVLVGDSGERDPEIYAALAREFPTQVDAIHIRDVSDEPRDAARYAQAYAGLDANLLTVFADARNWLLD